MNSKINVQNVIKNWLDTYIWKKDDRHYFMILCHESKKCLPEYLQKEQRTPSRFRLSGIDGINHYTIPVSEGYIRHISKQVRIESFIREILMKLTEDGIKNLYPDLYLTYKNRLCQKRNLQEFQEMGRLKNLGILPKKTDGYITYLTQHMSHTDAAKSSIR